MINLNYKHGGFKYPHVKKNIMKKVIISGNNKDIDSLLKMERLFIKQRGLLVKEEKISKKNTKHSTKEEKPVELTKELKPKLSNKSK